MQKKHRQRERERGQALEEEKVRQCLQRVCLHNSIIRSIAYADIPQLNAVLLCCSTHLPLCSTLYCFKLISLISCANIFALQQQQHYRAQRTQRSTFNNVQRPFRSLLLFYGPNTTLEHAKFVLHAQWTIVKMARPHYQLRPPFPFVLRLSVCLEQHFSHSTQRKSIE